MEIWSSTWWRRAISLAGKADKEHRKHSAGRVLRWAAVRVIIFFTSPPAGELWILPPNFHTRDIAVARGPLLLAPAGSLDAAVRAFAAGADAVYVGLKGWSRGGARGELSQDQLRDCLLLAHAGGGQVHLAANIIPKAHERASLLQHLADFADCGLDAVIVNDIGLLRDVRNQLPRLPVTVSIGCGALNLHDALFYQQLGAAAIVLPGNLEPPEIAEIKAHAAIQVEVMLHMVQEFLQLGKCWMPSYLNFAAAERPAPAQRLNGSVKRGGVGSCFRICQQPWTLLRDGADTGQRLLPSRQISRVAQIADFLAAGVDVIKIQGRGLLPDAVGAVVGVYRSAIDAWKNGQRVTATEAALPAMWTVQGR
jgi:putative protease